MTRYGKTSLIFFFFFYNHSRVNDLLFLTNILTGIWIFHIFTCSDISRNYSMEKWLGIVWGWVVFTHAQNKAMYGWVEKCSDEKNKYIKIKKKGKHKKNGKRVFRENGFVANCDGEVKDANDKTNEKGRSTKKGMKGC